MPKNTGRGSRSAVAIPTRSTQSSIWTTRSSSTGRFVRAKTDGGTFKPVAEHDPEPPREQD